MADLTWSTWAAIGHDSVQLNLTTAVTNSIEVTDAADDAGQ